MRTLLRASWCICLLVIVLLTGCKEGGPGRSGYLIAPDQQKVRVAVMPFDAAVQRSEDSGQVVAQEVVTLLVGSGMFEVVEPGAVYQALVELGVRNGYGLSPATMARLQDRIGSVDIFIVGMVQDMGEVRVGPASYPTISLNARVIDGRSGKILWSGSTSRTGSDSEKLFGIGAVHSSGRLARAAVRDLIGTLDQRRLAALLASAASDDPPARDPSPQVKQTAVARVSGSERFHDEAAVVSEADMRSSFVDLEGLVKDRVGFRQHHFSIAEAEYDGTGTRIRAKLVDYRSASAALGYVALEHPEESQEEFAGLPSFGRESNGRNPGAYSLDVAVGRFGLYVTGPVDRRSDIERVTQAIIGALK